jgi:hypothetical protein
VVALSTLTGAYPVFNSVGLPALSSVQSFIQCVEANCGILPCNRRQHHPFRTCMLGSPGIRGSAVGYKP